MICTNAVELYNVFPRILGLEMKGISCPHLDADLAYNVSESRVVFLFLFAAVDPSIAQIDVPLAHHVEASEDDGARESANDVGPASFEHRSPTLL